MPIDVTPASRHGSTGMSRKLGVAKVVMVACPALSLRWGHAPAWDFVNLTEFYYGGVSVLDGVDPYASRRRFLASHYGALLRRRAHPARPRRYEGGVHRPDSGAYEVSLAAIRCAVEIPRSTTVHYGLVGLSLEPVVRTIELQQIGVIVVARTLADLFHCRRASAES